MKSQIRQYKTRFRTLDSIDEPALEKYFVSVVVDSIIPYWYGTKWDFNGTTQTPGKGKIACGYFVTTVLRDAGLHLNRVKLAQAPSQTIVESLARSGSIKAFSNMPLEQTLDFVQHQGDGLFIVGLDYHVAFLYNDGIKTWLIHSKYGNPAEVVKEDAARSGILYYSHYRVVGKISNNKMLLHEWIFKN